MAKKTEETIPLHIFHGSKMDKLQALYNQWSDCRKCHLGEMRAADGLPEIVFASGNADAPIMIIGEGPGEEEARTGVPFCGNSGKLLNTIIAMTSDDPEILELHRWFQSNKSRGRESEEVFQKRMFEYREKVFFLTNVVGCRPTVLDKDGKERNRDPNPTEMAACWERLYNMIYIVDPLLIISVGKTASEKLIRHSVEITKQRGKLFDVSIQGRLRPVTYPVMVTLHPSYLLRNADWLRQSGDFHKTVNDWLKALETIDFLKNKSHGTPIPKRGQK